MKQSQEAAYGEYVTARMHPLRRTAFLLCQDWHLADDLVSMGKLYRHWDRAQRVERLDAYVHRMLLNAWFDEKRRPWRREQSTDDMPDHEAPPQSDTAERLTVLELLQQLPARKRAIVVLRFYCDLSVEETAEILGCAHGTVRSQSSRALETLRVLAAETPTSVNGGAK